MYTHDLIELLIHLCAFLPHSPTLLFLPLSLSLCPGLQAEKSLHSNSGTSVRDSGGHVEDDLGE